MDTLTDTQPPTTPKWFKFILFVGMLVFAFYASTHMVAAGDTWVAMACGRHFANHGVDTVEPFSFNSHPAGPSDETLEKYPGWTRGIIKKWHPTGWINQNWLTHLIFYKLATWFGDNGNYNYNALVYWKFAIYVLAVMAVYATGRLMGAGALLSAAGACFAMVIGRTFYDIRPSGYSNLLVPVFILLLALAVYKNYRWIWLVVPLVVFWANVHGGYLYAFIMFVPFVGIHLLLRVPRRWTVCVGFVGLWLVLYLMSYKFISHNYYLQVQKLLGHSAAVPVLFKDKILIVWIFLTLISLTLTILKKIKPGPFYAYHIGAGIIYFLSLTPRFFLADVPRNLSSQFKAIYSSFVSASQLSFFFVFVVGSLFILAMALKKERFITLSAKGICHTIGAGIVSFVAMIIFNPFHLTNLTHTFEISVSKHAESWRRVNEWKPAFDWMDKTTSTPNPVGEEEAFGLLCILMGIVLAVWLVVYLMRQRPNHKDRRSRKKPLQKDMPGEVSWPRIDLAMIVIALLTMYMAVRSRRFIAIAGIACPVLVMLIQQIQQMIVARIQSKPDGQIKAWPAAFQNGIGGGVTLVVVILAVIWGGRYKRIYLDPWPADDRNHSVFMRMTASHLKPFEVCQFINDNNISGHVFNYWTEGGAVAFGQTPDPETGQTPLRLFMDGRAQAAYNHETFRLWQLIHSGGPIAQKAMMEDKKITPEKMKDVGAWVDKQLRQYDVWVVLMPKTQENSTLMRALKQTANWKTAYLDETQHLLVNSETPQGETLLTRILEGSAVFPDAFSKNLTIATVIIETMNTQYYKDLYTHAKTAFEERPCPSAALMMGRLVSLPAFRKNVVNDLKLFLDDFIQNKDTYSNKNGFTLRATSAEIAAGTLFKLDPKKMSHYQQSVKQLRNETQLLNKKYIW